MFKMKRFSRKATALCLAVAIVITANFAYVSAATGSRVADKGPQGLSWTMVDEDKVEVTIKGVSADALGEISMPLPFHDVKEKSWFRPAVLYVTQNKLFNGVSGTSFAPDAKMTRGMLVTVLARYAKVDLSSYSGSTGFTDVSPNKYYAPAVKWASLNSIVTGTGNGKFNPETPISRQDVAVILYRYEQSIGGWLTEDDFSSAAKSYNDYGQVSAYAKEAVNWAAYYDIMTGANNQLYPKNLTTRAEMARILLNKGLWDYAEDYYYANKEMRTIHWKYKSSSEAQYYENYLSGGVQAVANDQIAARTIYEKRLILTISLDRLYEGKYPINPVEYANKYMN